MDECSDQVFDIKIHGILGAVVAAVVAAKAKKS
jgi:hypothetical protein